MKTSILFAVFLIFVDSRNIPSEKDNNEEDFPFLLDVDDDSRKEFRGILATWNISLTQKINLLDAWANKQIDPVQSAFQEWKAEAQEFINTMKDLHEKKTSNFSAAAKKADQKFFEIWQNDELTPQQKCQQFFDLYNFSSDAIKKEANLRTPSSYNCTEPPKFLSKTFEID